MRRFEIEPEVATWLDNLAPPHFDEVAEAIDRLRASGNHLRMPGDRMDPASGRHD